MRGQRMVWGWLLLGLAAYALLPWYYPQNIGVMQALRGALGGDETASGLIQASLQGRPWLGLGLAGLLLALRGAALPVGRAQGRWLSAGAGEIGRAHV